MKNNDQCMSIFCRLPTMVFSKRHNFDWLLRGSPDWVSTLIHTDIHRYTHSVIVCIFSMTMYIYGCCPTWLILIVVVGPLKQKCQCWSFFYFFCPSSALHVKQISLKRIMCGACPGPPNWGNFSLPMQCSHLFFFNPYLFASLSI